uniref:Peptidase C1A papain C-terminal domain-containing protein n=1 Tax=Polyblepharides amylifera TaxID=1486889 RepID=A0A7R9SWC0_9CHLO|mmetsp:Transcript_640/g.907  ORF Transcript_640/g.907 Transcript_640/m.907 type:complete len:362 (+) Transcript_640:104-1189(+)|eukprot:CAMPEP_0196579580 /NCGR_PEP_ID=MMETSP1081-20130531/23073_1 /TAXON_ID=36882 /ORGANISM="Pyramimonas amylifera, Strain CCMP720" /LENGTH=361 /DNA_ID=CAMNT_0041899209 /DNA_START=103 /DNA_END=1188 /DNA_ORIENTATION=+
MNWLATLLFFNVISLTNAGRIFDNGKPEKSQDATVTGVRIPKRINEIKIMPGHKKREDYILPLPSSYIQMNTLPTDFTWANISGRSYLTYMYNQHIPQYCGSCWLHGGMSTFQDRIKIARKGMGADIIPSRQFVLNCGNDVAGSCHGGSATGLYEFIKQVGYIPYESCLSYEACSAESEEGNCPYGDFQCKPINICRTCDTYKAQNGTCRAIETFPNVTVAEYGMLSGEDNMMAEIFARGPIVCPIDAVPMDAYNGGIIMEDSDRETDHLVEIIGWGYDEVAKTKFWHVRNSWGEYWGEMGFFRIKRGENTLKIEVECAWVTPGKWSSTNYPCWESGENCEKVENFVDPSSKLKPTGALLE